MAERTWGRMATLPMHLSGCTVAGLLAGCAAPAIVPPPVPPVSAPAAAAPGPAITAAAERPALRPAADRSGCRLIAAQALPLLPGYAGKPVVRLVVAGQAMLFWVDTGADTSVLSTAGARMLGIAPIPDHPAGNAARIVGFGGLAGYPVVTVPGLRFGGQKMERLVWPVMDLRGPDIAGLIGADLLAAYQVSFDFPAGQMVLYRAYGCAAPAPPWPATALPWQDASLPVVAATLDGRRVGALLDTGAQSSVVGDATSGTSGIATTQDPRVQSYGAGGMSFAARLHRFNALVLDGVAFSRPVLRVGKLPAQLPASAVIGADLLAGHRVWLDYAGRRAFLSP